MALGADEHRRQAPISVTMAIVTVSDTRTDADDQSGRAIEETAAAHGHRVLRRVIVKDEVDQIQKALRELIEDPEVKAVVINGGTGVAKRDVTLEAVEHFEEKTLPGFGELFRSLSYEEVGAAAMMSRAKAFVTEGKAVFCVPGSEKAVRLACTKLIMPELSHVIWELQR